ncbi:hypothetical protein [Chitinophaga sp. sic0106]|uniref:hypothetical protein n=1 Tax=Chitinophaga sp. sic0106 TaxID=2854785 RepID=UPI001C48F478|nr:hypothetical protein [Chitinophaga sp. sic0106]MBV7531760.1 hypothetical protein [Chitinophaga sp. sic0106]
MNIYEKLDETLKHKARFTYIKLQDPKQESDIIQTFVSAGVEDKFALSLLVEMYSWKDGIEYQSNEHTNLYNYSGRGVLLPLRFIKSLYDSGGKDYWEHGVVPIIGNYKGEYLFLDTNIESDTYTMILLYSKSAMSLSPMLTYYDSIESMLETNIKCFEEKIFNYVDGVGLIVDVERMFEISKEINPKSEFWE